MTKTEFIKELREMVDALEEDSFKIIDLPSGYIFGNRNYGEVNIKLADGVRISVSLFTATEEERGE